MDETTQAFETPNAPDHLAKSRNMAKIHRRPYVVAFIVGAWALYLAVAIIRTHQRSISHRALEQYADELKQHSFTFREKRVEYRIVSRFRALSILKAHLAEIAPGIFSDPIETTVFVRDKDSIALKATVSGGRITRLEILSNSNAMDTAEILRKEAVNQNPHCSVQLFQVSDPTDPGPFKSGGHQ
jgi:hypothetical protein